MRKKGILESITSKNEDSVGKLSAVFKLEHIRHQIFEKFKIRHGLVN